MFNVLMGIQMLTKAATTFGSTTMMMQVVEKAGLIPQAASTATKVCCGATLVGVTGHISDVATGYITKEVAVIANTPKELKAQLEQKKGELDKKTQEQKELEEFRKEMKKSLDEFKKMQEDLKKTQEQNKKK